MSRVIGIDLGTTNSVVAVIDGKEPIVITNEEGSRTTPSVVSESKNGERMVGTPARRQAVTNPKNTIYSAKRFMGMKFNEVKNELERTAYEVVPGKDGGCRIKLGGKECSPQEISASVLIKLKECAEKYLGTEVSEAVITVPAYFNDAQRQATRDAGKIAGLDVKRIINEPTAAALAYGLDQRNEQKIAVYDLGGGTFDISILEISDGVVEVLSTNGDTHLGGDDFDNVIIDWLIQEFKSDTGVDVKNDSMVMQRLREAAEKAKIELSATQQTEVNLPFLTADSTGPKHLQVSLTRAKFEQMIGGLIDRSLKPVNLALADSGLTSSEIDEVVLVGGSTRVPFVKRSVEDLFGKKANLSVNPDEVVALGAAIQGGVFSGEVNDLLLLDVTPLSLGIETLGGVMTRLIDRNSTIPCTKSETFSTAQDNQDSVEVHVLQGEREFAEHNKTLGKFKLSGIPPAPRGIPQIEVKFDIDANGIVNVSARDKATGKEQCVRIEDGGALSDEEIQRMVEDAQKYREADVKRKTEVDERNTLETIAYQAEKLINEYKDSETVPAERLTEIEELVASAKTALSSKDHQDIKDVLSGLQEKMQQVTTELYQKATEATQEARDIADDMEDDEQVSEDEIVDSTFEEAEEV